MLQLLCNLPGGLIKCKVSILVEPTGKFISHQTFTRNIYIINLLTCPVLIKCLSNANNLWHLPVENKAHYPLLQPVLGINF